MEEEVLSSLILELRRGTVVLCVLRRLETPMYGYNLITELAEYGIPAEANTLYPLLRRLESQGLLQSSWETSGAKPRKYYQTTPEGENVCRAMKKHWDAIAQNIQKLWEGTTDGK